MEKENKKIVHFCANMRPIIDNYKTVWVANKCECGEFRIYQDENLEWHCAKCKKVIKEK